MKIVIVGAGEARTELAKRLIIEKKNVILIEQNPEKAKLISRQLDCKIIIGSGNNFETLKQTNLNNTDYFIAATESDEMNIISCGFVGEKFNVASKIARVKNIDYSTENMTNMTFLGIDFIVNPEIEAAKKILNFIENGASSNIVNFDDDIQIRNLIVNKNSFLNGMKLRDVKNKLQIDFLIAGIKKGDKFLIPSGDTIIHEEDNLYFFATKQELEKIFTILGRPAIDIKNVLIVGGNKIGIYLAHQLIQDNKKNSNLFNLIFNRFFTRDNKKYNVKNVKIIDKNYDKCKELSELLPNATIINGDISDESLFTEEGLSNYDIIITATKNYELNILAALYAKRMQIPRALAIVAQKNYVDIAYLLGIDAVVNPKESIGSSILKFIRKGNIKSFQSIASGDVQVIEFSIEANSKLIGKKIKNINFPNQSLILSIVRNGKITIPNGEMIIEEKDNVVIVSKQKHIAKIEKMMAI